MGLLKRKKKTKALTAVIDLTLRQYTFTDVEMCDYYHNAMLEQKGPEGAFTALQTNTDLYRLYNKVEFGFLDSPRRGVGLLRDVNLF